MASNPSHPLHEGETLLLPNHLAEPVPRPSVSDSLNVSHSNLSDPRQSYSSVPFNQMFDPYAEAAATPSPRTTTPSFQYQRDPHPEKPVYYADTQVESGKRRSFWVLTGLVTLTLIAAAVVAPIYFKVIKPHNDGQSSHSVNVPGPSQSAKPPVATTGGHGSTVTTETGSFIYNNSFGGFWYYDPADPFKNSAQAQSWSPPLNKPWRWGTDQIRGTNLGGWLVLEPFITPALYEPYLNTSKPAIDEWTLCENIAADPNSGGVAKVIEDHYKTFITEEDFAQIAAAGLNWVRIPLAYWAIETYPGEPFLKGVSWKYFLKAIEWARKYGLRINLDLHAVPGSQNGYNHSGKLGPIGWLNGTMGIANAQRSLNHLRLITQFISQPQYHDVVPMFGVINEAFLQYIGRNVLESYYLEAYKVIRNITGYGEGKGPWISVHEGFQPLEQWAGFLPNGDRIALDTHPYFAFGYPDPTPITAQTIKPCSPRFNQSMAAFGMTAAGEFSNAFNDCGLFLNGVGNGARYDGTFVFEPGPGAGPGACVKWMDASTWSAEEKAAIKKFALSSMDSMQNFFFWNWKIGPSTTWGTVTSPLWSYKLGLELGWMPTDPREAVGACPSPAPWVGPLPPAKTGGPGAGPIDPGWAAARPWPPPAISGIPNAAVLPTYTPTAALPPLPPATFAPGVNPGNGVANPADQQQGYYTPVAGCPYPPNAWDAVMATERVCSGPAQRVFKGRYAMPRETGMPA